MSNTKSLDSKLAEFEAWVNGLSKLDAMNFKVLINLPNAADLLARMPEGKYREMAMIGFIVVKHVQEQSDK